MPLFLSLSLLGLGLDLSVGVVGSIEPLLHGGTAGLTRRPAFVHLLGLHALALLCVGLTVLVDTTLIGAAARLHRAPRDQAP
jgi:hypothetical protein